MIEYTLEEFLPKCGVCMAELNGIENNNESFTEIKNLIGAIKNNMVSNEVCNSQFQEVIKTLDDIHSKLGNIKTGEKKPLNDFAMLKTGLDEVRRELSKINTNVNNVICSDLNNLLTKLNEKVNRFEILKNNTGIDRQVVLNTAEHIEKEVSSKIKDTADMLRNDIAGVNGNMKECAEYLEKTWQDGSNTVIQHFSDDLTLLNNNIEKNHDNLKRSLIDLFTKIQEDISRNKPLPLMQAAGNTSESAKNDFEMLKNGIYNLNTNTEQHMNYLGRLISELDVFKKLERFSKLKDLPAIGDLKRTLQNNIDRIVDKYSYVLQSSQNQDEINNASRQFGKDIYNEILSVLGNVSEYFIEKDSSDKNVSKSAQNMLSSELGFFAEKIEELTSVTELNNSGYDNIKIEIKDLNDKIADISNLLQNNEMQSAEKNANIEKIVSEIQNNVQEIMTGSGYLKKLSTEIVTSIRDCARNVINTGASDRQNIKDVLYEIKKNLSMLQSGEEETDYTYSMQDIESDIAKIRVYLNELTQNGISLNSDEFNDELNSVVVMVDSMKQQINKIDEYNLSDNINKIKEDITSISTRVNKLILTHDSTYNLTDSALKEFKLLSAEIEEQVKSASSTDKLRALEDSVSRIKELLEEESNYNGTINQSLVMLAEWVDNAGETLFNISEKQDKLNFLDDIKRTTEETCSVIKGSFKETVSSVGLMLEDTNGLIKNINVTDYSPYFNELKSKIEQQNKRLDEQDRYLAKLDEKLTTLLEFSAKNDIGEFTAKISNMDLQLARLNKSIERITSYVNED